MGSIVLELGFGEINQKLILGAMITAKRDFVPQIFALVTETNVNCIQINVFYMPV